MEEKIKKDINEWIELDKKKSEMIKEWDEKFKEVKDKIKEMEEKQVKLLGFASRQELHFVDVINLLFKLEVLK